ncbi:MAG: metal-dependent transcriptional regulator [Clostridia bacterium]|nr:metal-dependent transcriptional regulator [Clostridia bacterium]
MFCLTSSLEDYLEIIYILSEKSLKVGITDIAKALTVSKPSAIKAIKILKNEKLVSQEKYGKILLTSEGKKAAMAVYDKHKVISKFLNKVLEISEKTAEIDACKIEHILSKETVNGIKNYLKNVKI